MSYGKFMRSLAYSLPLFFLMSSCSKNERLPGHREDLLKMMPDETQILENDDTPAVLDPEKNYTEYPQPFLNESHSGAPHQFSLNPSLIWSEKLDFEGNRVLQNTASPVAAEGKIFCADAAGIIYALDRKTGKRIWRVSTNLIGKDGQTGCALAYDSGKLIVSNSFSECFCLESKTGKILWRIKLPATCKGDGITIADGKAFILCANSTINAINLENGRTLWTHSGMISDSIFIGSAGACYSDGVLFVAYPSGEIFALQSENGTVLWDNMISKFSLTEAARARTHIRACPVVKEGRLYVVSSSGQITVFDANTGIEIWSKNVGGLQTPIVSGDSVFVHSYNEELLCLNKDTGALRWKKSFSSGEETDFADDWRGQILINGHIASVSPAGTMSFVSALDGRVVKNIDVGAGALNPIIADEVMYIQNNDSNISAYK